MKIVNVFDAVMEGNFEEFKKLYKGNVNEINEFSKFNLLQTALVESNNEKERIKIIDFLIKNGIDVNYKDCKYQRNALHVVFFNFLRGDIDYLESVVKLLVDAGVDINAVDKYAAIPLKYAITICKLNTEALKDIYSDMIKAGADYNLKDSFGKSCIDYAKEFSWRNDFIKIVEENEND